MTRSRRHSVRLTEGEILAAIGRIEGWSVAGGVITKSFLCQSFVGAIDLVVRVAGLAENLDHHPDIDIRWRTVNLSLTTHDSGGLTALDFELAEQIEATAAR